MKVRTFIVATALAAGSIVPLASPASARHNCGLQDVDHTVNTICDGYHDPGLIGYLICLILPTC